MPEAAADTDGVWSTAACPFVGGLPALLGSVPCSALLLPAVRAACPASATPSTPASATLSAPASATAPASCLPWSSICCCCCCCCCCSPLKCRCALKRCDAPASAIL